jgi:hypothetical protein
MEKLVESLIYLYVLIRYHVQFFYVINGTIFITTITHAFLYFIYFIIITIYGL